MHRLRNSPGAFRRRPDRSLGWAALESRQAAALGRELAPGGALVEPSSGIGLAPFAPPPRRRRVSVLGIARSVLAWVLALHLCYLAATAILISVYRRVDPPATVLMAYRKWRFGWKIEAPRPVKLAKVPKYVRRMLVAIEDYKFYEHHGIDMEAFARAREINKRLGKPLYGGSTLTMQVARTLFLVPEKSYVRKYLEVLTAFELEAILSKDRILELYFGYAEWGKGQFGIEDASRKWYGRGIAEISRDEAARLVSLLSSPIKYGPSTIYKSRILSERYSFLSYRYDASAAEASSATTAPASEAADAGAASTASSAAASGAQSAAIPPPSAEPEAVGEESSGQSEGAAPGGDAPADKAPQVQ